MHVVSCADSVGICADLFCEGSTNSMQPASDTHDHIGQKDDDEDALINLYHFNSFDRFTHQFLPDVLHVTEFKPYFATGSASFTASTVLANR